MSPRTRIVEGPRMDLRKITAAGERLLQARIDAELALETIVDELVKAGANRNIELAAELGNVGRPALYARLRKRQEENATAARKGPAR